MGLKIPLLGFSCYMKPVFLKRASVNETSPKSSTFLLFGLPCSRKTLKSDFGVFSLILFRVLRIHGCPVAWMQRSEVLCYRDYQSLIVWSIKFDTSLIRSTVKKRKLETKFRAFFMLSVELSRIHCCPVAWTQRSSLLTGLLTTNNIF